MAIVRRIPAASNMKKGPCGFATRTVTGIAKTEIGEKIKNPAKER